MDLLTWVGQEKEKILAEEFAKSTRLPFFVNELKPFVYEREMKANPIQQTKAGQNSQPSFTESTPSNTIAPPAFQLQAKEESESTALQGSPEVLTITNGNALIRGGGPNFESLGTTIPPGTRVEVLEEQSRGNSSYIRVKDHNTGAELGWTWKGNATDLDTKYKNANPAYAYHVDGFDLMVYLPKGGIPTSNVDVFFFFHGRGGDFTTTKTHAKNGGYPDNPAISGNIAEAVSNTGNIAICPQGHQFKVDIDW